MVETGYEEIYENFEDGDFNQAAAVYAGETMVRTILANNVSVVQAEVDPMGQE